MKVTVTAEAVASHASCDNEIVSVPERGRIDTVTRDLIVKVEGLITPLRRYAVTAIWALTQVVVVSGGGDGGDEST